MGCQIIRNVCKMKRGANQHYASLKLTFSFLTVGMISTKYKYIVPVYSFIAIIKKNSIPILYNSKLIK